VNEVSDLSRVFLGRYVIQERELHRKRSSLATWVVAGYSISGLLLVVSLCAALALSNAETLREEIPSIFQLAAAYWGPAIGFVLGFYFKQESTSNEDRQSERDLG